jgi:hypothetical protein
MNPVEGSLEQTQAWFERAVIGLNLCPFAKAVQAKGQIRWVVSAATTPDALLEELVGELRTLMAADPEAIDTTVLVHPAVLNDFRDFNDFLEVADAALAHLQMEGTLQIASFHPQYRFAGTPARDMANYTNRAPHPTLHLLREASVERAVAAIPDAAEIYQRNIDTLRKLGLAGWEQLLGLSRSGPTAPKAP